MNDQIARTVSPTEASSLILRDQDGGGRGTLRHVGANIVKLFGEQVDIQGAAHQQLWIDRLTSLNQDGFAYAGNVFVAIRITDGGIGREIPFEVGRKVEMQGMFIPADEATAGTNDPGLPVLHFTHRPVGFVVYDGVTYD
ncbi:hypothetical protein NFI95_00100 [Acetobacteraceae bacterium KSS8]|uniref:Uncharacterized protein n=1 Tax=Endosaccharibacter trunci TaxID=2812733 RepID=A0ABT1W1V5_9PROT|nr:hypothetical protein [Acetobacteraceae bacterium KSS8]